MSWDLCSHPHGHSLQAEPRLGPLGDLVLHLLACPCPVMSLPCVTCLWPSPQIPPAGWLGIAVLGAGGLRSRYAGLRPVSWLQGRILASSSFWWLWVFLGAWLPHCDPRLRCHVVFCPASLCLSLLFLPGRQPYCVLQDLIFTDDVCKDPASKWGRIRSVQVDGHFRGMLLSAI